MKRRNAARWLLALTSIVALLVVPIAAAAELHVMISAGFFPVYSELVPAFEKSTGHRVVTARGPSLGDSPEAIPVRLKRGEPADVVIGIGASLDDLGRQGLVRADSKVNLAPSEIGMVVRAGAPKPDIGSVAALRQTGDAEIGFQQVSELLHVSGVTFVGALPAELQQETFYSAALATAVGQPEAAQALIRFLASAEASPAIVKAGLAPATGR